MSFVELPLEGTMEEKSVPESVYDLRLETVKETTNEETGRLSFMCVLRIENPPEDNPNPAAIFHYLWMPMEGDEQSTVQMSLLGLKRFLTLFNVPFEGNGFNPEDLPGSAAECLLAEEEYEGMVRNVLRLPALAD